MRLKNNVFVISYLAFIVFGGVLLLLTKKGDVVLWLNNHHVPFGDFVFKYGTHLGDGLMFIPFLFILLYLKKHRESAQLAVIALFTLIFSQGLKKTVFLGWPRPTAFFEGNIAWNYVEGVEIARVNTFPSGHTLTAFAIFFFASLLVKSRPMRAMFFAGALLAGISRVYLLQHFFVDIYFGSFLGMLSVVLGMALQRRLFT